MRPGRKAIDPSTKLGILLREKRGDRPGDEAAAAAGIDKVAYYRLERGVQAPSIQTCRALAAYLGLTAGQVLDLSLQPASNSS